MAPDAEALGRIKLLASPTDPPFRPGSGATRRCSLANHRAFELGESPNHLHHHPPGRGGRMC
jgi:hypothetical protein